jgi:hypothetical protein
MGGAMMKARTTLRLAGALAGGAAATSASVVLLRGWQRMWDATPEETARPLPLDDEVSEPTYVTNRAITVSAQPEDLWPWIAQMGELPRGGFYSYVSVERLLGLKVRNAARILPGFKSPKPGEAIDRAGTMLVKAIEPNRVLVLGPLPSADLAVTWAIALFPSGDGPTRILSRCRARLPRGPRGFLMSLVLDPGQFLMERKMLLELRRRGLRSAADRPIELPWEPSPAETLPDAEPVTTN